MRANLAHARTQQRDADWQNHFMEAGTDTRIIQDLLAHNNSKIDGTYTHVAQCARLPSPLDNLGL